MSAVSIAPLLVLLAFIAIPIALFILFYKAYKKHVKQTTERLNIEKQQTFHLQHQVTELNDRVQKLENLLREVD